MPDSFPSDCESSPSSIEDGLSTFLETYPTKLRYMRPQSPSNLWVFWSENDEQSHKNSSSDDPEIPDPSIIHERIQSALSEFDLYEDVGLIQFWAPVEIGGRRLLTTSDQPFALRCLDGHVEPYRLRALEYKYDIEVNNLEVEDDPKIISGAPASRAFLKRFPEVVPDLTVGQRCPLVLSALEHGLKASFVLPVFSDPSQSCCIGVFECCYVGGGYHSNIVHLVEELKEEGLYPYDMEAHISSMNICGLEDARNEIDKALQVIIVSHRIDAVQVWIADEDENHVGCSPSLGDTKRNRLIGRSLTSHVYVDEDYLYRPYIDMCRHIPLVNEEGLIARAFHYYLAHFCKNFSVPDDDAKRSCFTICLKNSVTHDLLYVLEFLWGNDVCYIILLEALFLTLQRYLPSFKFASGALLGDELLVIDVDNSTGSGTGFFEILKRNRLASSMLNALEVGNRPAGGVEECLQSPLKAKCKTTKIELPIEKIEQQFGKTMKEAAKNLNVSVSTLKRKWNDHMEDARRNGHVVYSEWQGPKFVNRKADDTNNDQSGMNDEDNGVIEDFSIIKNRNKSTLTIKAEYADDMIKFDLPISTATIVAVEKKIGEEFKLNHGSYKIKYLDEEGDWILLNSEQHMKYCIESFGRTLIRLLVTNI